MEKKIKASTIILVILVFIFLVKSGATQSEYDTLYASYEDQINQYMALADKYAELELEYEEYRERMEPSDGMREAMCNALSSLLLDCITPGVYISGIRFIGKTLVIDVDFSKLDQNPTGFTFKDLATSNAKFITNEILKHKEYDAYWDEIKVDFGSVGYALGDKSMVKTSSQVLGRYFDFGDNVIIEK